MTEARARTESNVTTPSDGAILATTEERLRIGVTHTCEEYFATL
jgi:hypothetical protein